MVPRHDANALRPALTASHRPARAGALLPSAMALMCGVAGLWLAHQHPLAPWTAPLLFVLATATFGRWPMAWPTALPALLPLIGLAPWTGWITFEEWDLLVLAIATGGCLRRAVRPASAPPLAASERMSPFVLLVIALYAGAMLVSAARGIADAGGFAFGLFQGYREPMNSLRLAKSLFAALLLYPLWTGLQRADPVRSTRRLIDGLVLGLLATALAATWERLAFTGLLNFSTDYRTTALFWEMHVGGAALDGMLALTFPFLLRELVAASSQRRWIVLACMLPIAAYASLTTFSRGVYLAVPLGGAVMLAVQAMQSPSVRSLRQRLFAIAPAALLVAGFAWATSAMFPTSGYRGLMAVLGAAALLLALPSTLRGQPRRVLAIGAVAGGLLVGLAWAAAAVLPKGAYVVYAVLAIGTLGVMALQHRRPDAWPGDLAPPLALAGFLATLVAAAWVAAHWGGAAALHAAWPVLALLLLVLMAAIASPSPLWPSTRRWQAGTAATLLLAAGVVAAFGGGVYMTTRFSTSESDFEGRVAHWRQGLAMLHGPQDLLLGRGLGRFVDNHAFNTPANQVPGDYRLRREGDNRFVSLVAGTHELGWGELLRLSQRVSAPTGPTFVQADVRSNEAPIVHFEVCFKHLLYDGGCMVKTVRLPAQPGQWQHVNVRLDGMLLRNGDWYAPRLVMFSVATENAGVRVDIDNLELTGADGRNQLANGDFQADLARWFMTSDRYHMPWHLKNLVVNVLFDQGVLGVTLLAVLVVGALMRVTLGPARAHPLAPGVAGGLAGFLAVGMFDSLLDVPRVAFLFYFLVLLGLTLKPPRPRPPGVPAA